MTPAELRALAAAKGITVEELKERLSPGQPPTPPRAKLKAYVMWVTPEFHHSYEAWGDTEEELAADIKRVAQEHGAERYWTERVNV